MPEHAAGPRCGNNPAARLAPGDREAVEDFRTYLAHRTESQRMTPACLEVETVVEVAERHREVGGRQVLVGRFWGPPGTIGAQGIAVGTGFQALADDFPPGTRMVVTARIELPEQSEAAP
ncbi:hypothetical protein PV341_38125 [Streptomyces sp. PA03-1a]|nr:hypothetical protein [Streptomyces sp. PA03-1a]